METKIVKAPEARIFLEGVEVCREYFRTEKITFGTSELMPGQTGAVDPGHASSHEVFYVVKGTVLLRCGEALYELHEGAAPAHQHRRGKVHRQLEPGAQRSMTERGTTA